MKSVFEKVQDYCNKEKISFHALEKGAGIGNGTISRWSSSTPSIPSLIKISEYTGIPMSELVESLNLKV